MNDHVINMFTIHMHQVKSLSDKAVCEQLLGDHHEFRNNKQKGSNECQSDTLGSQCVVPVADLVWTNDVDAYVGMTLRVIL